MVGDRQVRFTTTWDALTIFRHEARVEHHGPRREEGVLLHDQPELQTSHTVSLRDTPAA